MMRILITVLIISGVNRSFGQDQEALFAFDYMLAPMGESDIDFYKTGFKAAIPTKLKKGVLTNSVGLNYYRLDYNDRNYDFFLEDLTAIYNLNYSLGYEHLLSKKWSLNGEAMVSVSSNLTNTITRDDLIFSGSFFATHKIGTETKPAKLMFGLSYTALLGSPFFMPVFNYIKQVNSKLSYGVGFPNTYVNYNVNERSGLKASILMDGVYSNLSNKIPVNINDEATKASYISIDTGIEYNYRMDDFWVVSFTGGYSLYNNYTLENSFGDDVYNFEATSRPFFSAGIKFNLKSNKD
ncbi:MAG: DUF6268 family outer membrane beta-barrel protein [Algibacter sp.]